MAIAIKNENNGSSEDPLRFSPSGKVEVDAFYVRVDATFDHPDIVSYAQNDGLGLDPVGALQTLIVCGIASSLTGGAYALAQEARRTNEGIITLLGAESEGLIRAALKRAVGEDGEDGAFMPEVERIVTEGAKSVQTEAEKLTSELKGAGEDAVPQIIERRVRKATGEVVDGIMRKALAEDGAIGIRLANNEKAIKELSEALTAMSDGLLQARLLSEQPVDPAAAGREWQPSVVAEIARLSVITGDRVEETGDLPGPGRSRKGDAVLHLACPTGESTLKVAIECRTGAKRLSLAELRLARENRSADSALLLAERPEALPKDAEALGFRAYWDQRAVVLHHDPDRPESGLLLATALQVSRMFAQLAAAASAGEINQDVIRQSISRIEKGLSHLKPLRASASGIEKEIGNIRRHAQDIETELRGSLGELGGIAA
jgi:hypothetical protein